MKKEPFKIFLFIVAIMVLATCSNSGFWTGKAPLFRLLDKEKTGLDFQNVLRATSEFNIFNYEYFFNGGGVAIGDFNNDGLADLYFTANMSANKLFLNQGNLRFKDVTEEAGLAGMEGWTAGASVVDINNDGLLDIYVSQIGEYQTIKGKNQLFICQEMVNGVPVYVDKAQQYGLNLSGFSTQASFFDYDLDGDLDLFQLNHSTHANTTFGSRASFSDTHHPASGDKLLRNDGDYFTDVTKKSGINSSAIGYGRGIATADVNLDGWPDIYVTNDFYENDYLYLNQHNGTFKDVLTQQIQHTSRDATGVDMADINNDGFADIFTADHLAKDPVVLKTTLGEEAYNSYRHKITNGYHPQYARNALQLNNTDGTFSELASFSGVAASDWSWASLFLDFDFDGYKDLFISNGINRRHNDIDYLNYRANNEIRWIPNTNNLEEEDLAVVEQMPKVKHFNNFFRNNGQLHFEDASEQITDAQKSFSNGAAYADLDNDGDIDIVVNNIEDAPFIYENLSIDGDRNQGGDFLHLSLIGSPHNRQAIGTTIVIYKGAEKIIHQHFPVRGYQSCMGEDLHIGLGDGSLVDSIVVIWPLQQYQKLRRLVFNEKITLSWQRKLPKFDFKTLHKDSLSAFRFWDITEESGINFQHKEDVFLDFNTQPLLPWLLSNAGPGAAVGDANIDTLMDLFVGGAKGLQSRLFIQQKNGRLEDQTPQVFSQDSIEEHLDAVWADIDNDNDLDLIVAAELSGLDGLALPKKQVIYLNNGQANFERDTSRFDSLQFMASTVAAGDFNGDGWMDLFFGNHAEPGNYGLTPRSYLFLNTGDGYYTDVTDSLAVGLSNVGMIKDAYWKDMDLDGDQDLVLALPWQPIQIFTNESGMLEGHPINDLSGWWNFVYPYDFDQDGDLDLMAGNLGTNTRLLPHKEEPVSLYVNDFDEDGQVEQILTYFLSEKEIPFASFVELTTQLPEIKERYPLATDFAAASVSELFPNDKLETAITLQVNTSKSMYFENTGQQGLQFIAHTLPDHCQFSTLNAVLPTDLDEDGIMEVMAGGNSYGSHVELGRYDASFGQILSFNQNVWNSVPLSDVRLDGQIRHILSIVINGVPCVVIVKNDGALQVLKKQK